MGAGWNKDVAKINKQHTPLRDPMARIKLFTVGFTRRTAESFFSTLIDAGVRRVIDIRLHNTNQLCGFPPRLWEQGRRRI